MDADLKAMIHTDCSILLTRAFKGQTFTIFGEDGLGQHGRSDTFITARCLGITITLRDYTGRAVDVNDLLGEVDLVMEGYDARVHGLAITDKNLRISIDRHLDTVGITRDIIQWGDAASQGRSFINLIFNPAKLLLC